MPAPARTLGVAAAGHPAVAEAACATLRIGGNAFDAAVAAGFASTVAEPALTSLAGGGFLLARTAAGSATLFDFFVDTPGLGDPISGPIDFSPITVPWGAVDQDFHIGKAAAAVPGTLKGLMHVHNGLGCLDLPDILAPAIRLARDGLPLHPDQAHVLNLLRPIMLQTPASRALYERDGDLMQPGAHYENPDLANFLTDLADEPTRTFYEGTVADQVARQLSDGGLITRDDLAHYTVAERTPLKISYRGLTILTNPAPSLGGALLATLFRLLETIDLRSLRWGSSEHAVRLATAMKEVDDRRNAGQLDDDGRPVSTRGTTHLSIADAEGNVATLTASNGEGCGHLIEGTGIMLNNMLGEEDLHPDGFHASPPGERVASMMAPTVVLKDDHPVLVLGSGGSKRIRTAIPQVISNIVDFDMDLADAIKRPRIHWEDGALQFEPGYDDDTVAALQNNLPATAWPRRSFYFGGVHAVIPAGEGAGDDRRGGCAAVAYS